MGRALDIDVKVIPSGIANAFVKRHHYSGKVVQNSSLHFGVFLDGKMHGVMSYGPSTDKSKLIGLVEGTKWSNFIELNRMAFDDYLPRNSESRAISLSMKLMKRHAPQIKWVVSFADGCSCGDGTIYRASNFVLTGVKENKALYLFPNGERVHQLTFQSSPTKKYECLGGRSILEITGGSMSMKKVCEATGAIPQPGFQFRYVYFIDKSWRKRLRVREIPFSVIDELGAGMYRGERITREERHVDGYLDIYREARTSGG